MNKSLKKKLIFLFLLVGLTPLLSAFVASVNIRSKSILNQSIESMKDIGKLKKQEIEEELLDINRELKIISNFIGKDNFLDNKDYHNNLHKGIKAFAIFEGDNILYFSDNKYKDFSNKKTLIKDNYLYLIIPLENKKYINAKIDLKTFDNIINDLTGLGTKGQGYIIDENFVLLSKIKGNISQGNNIYDYMQNNSKEVIRIDKKLNLGGVNASLILEKNRKEVNKPIVKMLNLSIIVTLFCTILIFFMGYYIANSFTKPIIQFIENFEKATIGHLNTRVHIKRKDELGLLAQNFNTFMETIEKIFSQVDSLAKSVEESGLNLENDIKIIVENPQSGIPKLQDSIKVCLDNISSQSASLEESLASLETISANSNLLSQLFEESQKEMSTTSTLIQNSQNDMDKLTNNMDGIEDSLGKVDDNINLLIKLLSGIEGILGGIYNISAKTNLLSLNAAIESARAGKEGKGFSVVAEEIRKLSIDTNDETKKIESLIDKIKLMIDDVNFSNKTMEEFVTQGALYAKRVGGNMDNIYRTNKNNSDNLKNLTNSIEDQKNSTNEITNAISLITEDSLEIESNIVETDKINQLIKKYLVENLSKSRQLVSRSRSLDKLLKSFKK